MADSLTSSLNQIIGGSTPTVQNAGSSLLAPIQQIMNFNPTANANPNVSQLFNDAYNQLAPYYTQLLQEANGDYNLALQYLQRDYQTGVRYANEDVQRVTQQVQENLTNSLQQLGITTTSEQQSLLDTLNKRGIALSEVGTSQAPAAPQYGAGGESGYETNTEDQSIALRNEALNTNAKQQITNQQVTSQRANEQAGFKLQEGTTAQQQSLRNTQEGLMTNRISQATGIAQNEVSQDQAAQQLQNNNSGLQNLVGGGSNNTAGSGLSDAQKHINPASGVWDDNYFSKTYG